MIDLNDSFEPRADRAAGDVIDGEAIIINLETGVYYSMQGAGGRVWAMLAGHRTVRSMIDEMVMTYEVTADVVSADIHAVLRQLLDEGLIQRSSEPSDTIAVGAAERQPYQRPRLEIYRDMQDLLALDPPAPGMNQISWSNGSKR